MGKFKKLSVSLIIISLVFFIIFFLVKTGKADRVTDETGFFTEKDLIVSQFLDYPVPRGLEDISFEGLSLDDIGGDSLPARPYSDGDGLDQQGKPAETVKPAPPARPSSPDSLAYTDYTVKKGDSLSKIASRFGIKKDTIYYSNSKSIKRRNALSPGTVLSIPSIDGMIYTVKSGESLWDISRYFKIPISRIIAVNQIDDPARMKKGEKIFLPGSSVFAKMNSMETVGGSGKRFAWPVRGRLSSPFGMRRHPIYKSWRFHAGIDIAARKGSPVTAAYPGTVIYSGWMGGYGNIVVVKHKNGVVTCYGHNRKLDVVNGQNVKQGQVIARVGETGTSTGPHCHFEVRKNGKLVNPLSYLR